MPRPMTRQRLLPKSLLGLIVSAAATAPVSAQSGDFQLETTWVLNRDAAHPGETVHAVLGVTVPGKYHLQSNAPLDEFLVPTVLTVTPPEGWTMSEVVYPEPVLLDAPDLSDVPMAVFEHEFVIGVAIRIGVDVEPGTYPIGIKLQYQACDDKLCYAPTHKEFRSTIEVVPVTTRTTGNENPLFDGIVFSGDAATVIAPPRPAPTVGVVDADCDILARLAGFKILGTTGGYLDEEDFIAFIDGAETGTIQESWFADKGPVAIVLMVVAFGVLLNLTPCVLPLVPINLAIIGAGAQSGPRRRGFALGGTYGLAMAVVYGLLGLVVILTTATFGAINGTIWFNAGIAVLFVVLGLAMFDVLHVDFSKLQGKFDASGMGKKGSFALAFGMGGITSLLAGACVAPVVIQVIVYASDQYAKGSTIALALPFFLGFGMALPWPFAGAGLSFLPKPGMWMVRVKQAMGVVILAFAIYYGYLGWKIYDSTRVDAGAVAASVQEQLDDGWTASICAGLAVARTENKLVLVDMWATWCKACLYMEKTTFEDAAVLARLEDYVKIKYQAQPLTEPPASDVLDHFSGVGLPTYAILRPRAD